MGQLHIFKASLRINLSRTNIRNMVFLSSMNLRVFISLLVGIVYHTQYEDSRQYDLRISVLIVSL